jgi:hypothetical protein
MFDVVKMPFDFHVTISMKNGARKIVGHAAEQKLEYLCFSLLQRAGNQQKTSG